MCHTKAYIQDILFNVVHECHIKYSIDWNMATYFNKYLIGKLFVLKQAKIYYQIIKYSELFF